MYTCLVFKNLFRIFILWLREIVCSIHKSSVLISSYGFDQINYLISGFMRFGDVTNISLYSHIFFLKKTLLWALLVFIAWAYYNLDVMIEVANFYCQNYQSRTKSTISLNLIWFLLKKKNTEDIILWVFFNQNTLPSTLARFCKVFFQTRKTKIRMDKYYQDFMQLFKHTLTHPNAIHLQ